MPHEQLNSIQACKHVAYFVSFHLVCNCYGEFKLYSFLDPDNLAPTIASSIHNSRDLELLFVLSGFLY